MLESQVGQVPQESDFNKLSDATRTVLINARDNGTVLDALLSRITGTEAAHDEPKNTVDTITRLGCIAELASTIRAIEAELKRQNQMLQDIAVII